MCVHASTHSRSHTGSMNIIMWPVGHKHSETSRGVKGLAASSMFGPAARTPLHGSFYLDFWIVLTGKALAKTCQRGPEAWQRVCVNVCGWMRLRLLSRVVRLKKDRQRRDKGRAGGKSDSLSLSYNYQMRGCECLTLRPEPFVNKKHFSVSNTHINHKLLLLFRAPLWTLYTVLTKEFKIIVFKHTNTMVNAKNT